MCEDKVDQNTLWLPKPKENLNEKITSHLKKYEIPEVNVREIVPIPPEVGCWGQGQNRLIGNGEPKDKIQRNVINLIESCFNISDRSILLQKLQVFIEGEHQNIQIGKISPLLYCIRPEIYPIVNEGMREGFLICVEKLPNGYFKDLLQYPNLIRKMQEFRDLHNLNKDFADLDGLLYKRIPEINPPRPRTNKTYCDIEIKRLHQLLDYKKQVILFGPPGTGKTWLAKYFVTHSIENAYFWVTTNPDVWAAYTDWGPGKEESFSFGPIKEAYENIKKGDLVFAYLSKYNPGRFYAIGRCSGKGPDKNGNPSPLIRCISKIDGPTWYEIKDDPILSNSKPIKMNAQGTLFQLSQEEGVRLLELTKIKKYEWVTFNPAFSYEEFVEGLYPSADKEGHIQYSVKEGIFKKQCREAYNQLLLFSGVEKPWKINNNLETGENRLPRLSADEIEKVKQNIPFAPSFFLIIDEINRGEISRIFGDQISLIEADKRLFCKNEITLTLPYSQEEFGVPPNLFIIGTMNSTDRNIALIDTALRRRFGFVEMVPNYQILEDLPEITNDGVKEIIRIALNALKQLNTEITKMLGKDHVIGHSYFLDLRESKSREDAIQKLQLIWECEIVPLLQEYFYGSPEKMRKILDKDLGGQKHLTAIEFLENMKKRYIVDVDEVSQENGADRD